MRTIESIADLTATTDYMSLVHESQLRFQEELRQFRASQRAGSRRESQSSIVDSDSDSTDDDNEIGRTDDEAADAIPTSLAIDGSRLTLTRAREGATSEPTIRGATPLSPRPIPSPALLLEPASPPSPSVRYRPPTDEPLPPLEHPTTALSPPSSPRYSSSPSWATSPPRALSSSGANSGGGFASNRRCDSPVAPNQRPNFTLNLSSVTSISRQNKLKSPHHGAATSISPSSNALSLSAPTSPASSPRACSPGTPVRKISGSMASPARAQPPSPAPATPPEQSGHKRAASEAVKVTRSISMWDFGLSSLGSLGRSMSKTETVRGTSPDTTTAPLRRSGAATISAATSRQSPARVRLFEDYPFGESSATLDLKQRTASALTHHVPRLAEITTAPRPMVHSLTSGGSQSGGLSASNSSTSRSYVFMPNSTQKRVRCGFVLIHQAR